MAALETKSFIKAVSQYFMDFLETDFHRHRTPRRSIKLQNSNSLLVGVNLDKYPSFASLTRKTIACGFEQEQPINVQKGVFKSDIPQNLVDLINLKAKRIETEDLKKTLEDISKNIEDNSTAYREKLITAIEESQNFARAEIRKKIVDPFIAGVEESLKKLELADELIVESIASELTDIISNPIEERIPASIEKLIAGEEANPVQGFKSLLGQKIVKEHVVDYFEELKINDLFAELYELNQNQAILDKQEFYLYFGAITYNKAKYPIFYLPFALDNHSGSLSIDFDSRIYINKKSLEYIAQEYNEQTGREGKLKEITDRIIYTAEYAKNPTDLLTRLNLVLEELHNFFELEGSFEVQADNVKSNNNKYVKLSNELYMSLYDKSDEALINDYEEILALEEDDPLFGQLSQLINDFISKDPESVIESVDDDWDGKDTADRLVTQSPIPLNSEQQKILSALKQDDCNYVAVEGPPGTGKSHTITAIVFDAILNNQSVLVLSDKKEALDVVEDKISSTMNEVRFEENFQNPVLRLGKTGNTYRQILSPASFEKIKTNFKAVKKQIDDLEKQLTNNVHGLKEDLAAEQTLLEKIEITDLHELVNLEEYVSKNIKYVDLEEAINNPDSVVELGELRNLSVSVGSYLETDNAKDIVSSVGFRLKEGQRVSLAQLKILAYLNEKISQLKIALDERGLTDSLSVFNSFSDKQVTDLYRSVKEYESLKKPIIGYSFSKTKLAHYDIKFKETFDCNIDDAHAHLDSLKNFYNAVSTIEEFKNTFSENLVSKIDYQAVILHLLKKPEQLTESVKQFEDFEYLNKLVGKFPKSSKLANINLGDRGSTDNAISLTTELEFNKLLRYISLYQSMHSKFDSIPSYNYLSVKKDIERLSTIKMTYLMDKRVVDFYTKKSATVKVLKGIISSKEKFPRDEFQHLKQAFPCILAGIRDYAEYIPLEKDLFDLVIIDEASQVSIAQAFPALLRTKKALILGDRLQFGNVKATQARSSINTNYVNNLHSVFTKNISRDAGPLKKLEYFDIKKSVLDFFEFISNYKAMLRKHFRGYKENISFSNKFFYNDGLQVMKIRAKPVSEVLKFTVLDHDGKNESIPNTNKTEIEFIQSQIQTLIDSGVTQSVGVITPHTNQQKRIAEALYKNLDRDYLDNKLNLKVMTFDTCQGEERDIIFYSMVATKEDDKLMYIFSSSLSTRIDDDGTDNLRRQRLNVGLSRSRETMHFVLSKPINDYGGAIGDALKHYEQQLEDSKKEATVEQTDNNSPMEKKVLNWFYQTEFWKKNKDNIAFDPQFEIGAYLKQLDPTYSHPNYKVDFLLSYKDETEKFHQIIIEYDGFEEHFIDRELVDQYNYQNYMSGDDLERQKVLESYGYKFIRINKFNSGDNPIESLDKKIDSILTSKSSNNFLGAIGSTIEGLQNGEIKECPKCSEVKELKEFKDSNLSSGYGRFCMGCKSARVAGSDNTAQATSTQCSTCGAKMVIRNGRYGKFYGCSRYPYCKNTVNIR